MVLETVIMKVLCSLCNKKKLYFLVHSKHLSSTFRPMIGHYMSDDQLADHVNRQMTFFHKKYEPDIEPVEEDKV